MEEGVVLRVKKFISLGQNYKSCGKTLKGKKVVGNKKIYHSCIYTFFQGSEDIYHYTG